MDFKKLKEQFIGDSEVILSTEEFLQRIKVGDTFYAIKTVMSIPINIYETILLEIPNTNNSISKYAANVKTTYSYTSGVKSSYDDRYFIGDFFYASKCICLTEDKAKEVFHILRREYENNEEWQQYSKLDGANMVRSVNSLS
jgi:hypothetical protein